MKRFLSMRKLAKAAVERILGTTITHFITEEPVAALTFDDGPHPEYTPRLLNILDNYGARATFFMLGETAQRYPHIAKSVAERGHAIGNHSWDHPSFPLISRASRREQLQRCQEAIQPYGSYLFRPPFGHQNWRSMLEAKIQGYEIITWNLKGMDWMDHDSLWMADFMEAKIKPGSIILLHDALHDFLHESYLNRMPTLEAVELILQRLKDRMKFLTIPEMFKFGKPQRRIWVREGDSAWLNDLKKSQYKLAQ
jgi:peptidoglycan-N-acetylglucosamine deacetylase